MHYEQAALLMSYYVITPGSDPRTTNLRIPAITIYSKQIQQDRMEKQ